MNNIVPFAPAHGAGADREDPGSRYAALLDIMQDRVTAREFDRGYRMPRSHIEKIIDAAALAPSGANTQPWHYVVVTDQQAKRRIADSMVECHARRAGGTGRLHAVDYAAMGHAPGFLAVIVDPRMTWAFPGLMAGSELDQPYHAHAERILTQSVAASTMAASLAAASLGYQTWWVSALGLDDAKTAIAAMLGVPCDLQITDFLLFGPALLPPEHRWKKSRDQIASWDRFDMAAFKTVEQIDDWLRDTQPKTVRITDGD